MIPIKLNIQRFASTTIYLNTVYLGSVSFQGKLECTSITDSNNNQSTVTVELWARKQNSSQSTYGKGWSGNITIDGTSSSFSSLSSIVYVGNSWVKMYEYSKIVSHNVDGSKTIYISGYITPPSGTSMAGKTSSGGDNFALDTIPRYFSVAPSITLASKTETEMVYNWTTSETCSSITLYGGGSATFTGIGGTSGTIIVTGLTANTSYSHYGSFTRSDSGLASVSNIETNSTFPYPTITSTPSFTIGNQIGIEFLNPRALSCQVYLVNSSGQQFGGDTTTGTSIWGYNNAAWQDFFYNSIPNSASGQYKVRLICTALGRDTIVDGGTFTIDFNESKPTFNNFQCYDVNPITVRLINDGSVILPDHTAVANKIIEGFSTLRVDIPNSSKATGYKGSTMEYYNINAANWAYADDFTTEPDNIPNYAYNYVNVWATDTRGNTKLVTKSIPYVTGNNGISYFKPTASISSNDTYYTRSNQGVGTQVTFNFKGTFWNDNFGFVDNSLTATYEFKPVGSSGSAITGTTPITLTISGNNYSFSGILAGDASDDGFDIDKSYNVVITVSDELASVQFNYVVIEGSPAIDLFGNCISLGDMYDEALGGRVQINGYRADEVILRSFTGITELEITSSSGYGNVFLISPSYIGDIQLANSTINFYDVFGNRGNITGAIQNNVATIINLSHWEHYILIGSSVITSINGNI